MIRAIIKCPPIVMPILLSSQLTYTILISILLCEVFHNPLICSAIATPIILFNLFILVSFIHYYDIIASHLDPVTTLVEAKLNGKEICQECHRYIIKDIADKDWLSLYRSSYYPECLHNYCAVKNAPLIVRILLWRIWV